LLSGAKFHTVTEQRSQNYSYVYFDFYVFSLLMYGWNSALRVLLYITWTPIPSLWCIKDHTWS
jgi:hypothetical protein